MSADPFHIPSLVPQFETIKSGYAAASEGARARLRHHSDIRYGMDPAERLDLFFPADMQVPAPIHLFIHGGYWRANRKEDYAFVAEPITAAGAIAAMVEYPLMPAARLAHLVAAVRRAAAWIVKNARDFGGNADALSASGHSAGAHLAFYLAARGPHEPASLDLPIRTLLLLSGVYDLRPLPRSFLQAEIELTPEEIHRWSPLSATVGTATGITIAVGADESAPFRGQSEALARKVGTTAVALPGLDHMTIQRDLGQIGTEVAGMLRDTILRSRR